MDLGLRDHVYVVSGGSTGLGFATATRPRRPREHAWSSSLAMPGRMVDAAVRPSGGVSRAVWPPTWPTRRRPTAPWRSRCPRFGRLDGGLISVGGPPGGSPLTTTDEQWRRRFDSVFLGSVRLARALCAGIADSADAPPPAAIAWVLSTSAVEVFTGLTTSNGLRPGLAMLVKDLADEVGPSGIRVNGLLPGRIATDRLAALDAATGDAERLAAPGPVRASPCVGTAIRRSSVGWRPSC